MMETSSQETIKHLASALIDVALDGLDIRRLPGALVNRFMPTPIVGDGATVSLRGSSNGRVIIEAFLSEHAGSPLVSITMLEEESLTLDDIAFYFAYLLAICACLSTQVEIKIDQDISLDRVMLGTKTYVHLVTVETEGRNSFRVSGLERLLRNDIIESYKLISLPNHFVTHLALGLFFSQRLLKNSDSHFICLGTGSISRGFADESSDVDLFIVCNGSICLPELSVGEHMFRGISIDLKVAIDDGDLDNWNMVRRWCVLEGVELFSRNDYTAKPFLSRLELSEPVRMDHIQCLIMHLSWIGFHPRAWARRHYRGYDWPVSARAWVSRGHPEMANRIVDRAFNLMTCLMFLVNAKPYPGAKWQGFLIVNLKWLPRDFGGKRQRLFPTHGQVESVDCRIDAMLDLIDDTFAQLEVTGMLADNIYAHSLKCFEEGRGFLDNYR